MHSDFEIALKLSASAPDIVHCTANGLDRVTLLESWKAASFTVMVRNLILLGTTTYVTTIFAHIHEPKFKPLPFLANRDQTRAITRCAFDARPICGRQANK